MGRRIHVDGSLGGVGLPAAVLNDLYEHARVVAPEECCGLVARWG